MHLGADCRRGCRRARQDRPPREVRRPWRCDVGRGRSVPGQPPTGYDDGRAPVAQWTERGRPKACVGGSSPSGGAKKNVRRGRSPTRPRTRRTRAGHHHGRRDDRWRGRCVVGAPVRYSRWGLPLGQRTGHIRERDALCALSGSSRASVKRRWRASGTSNGCLSPVPSRRTERPSGAWQCSEDRRRLVGSVAESRNC